MQLEKAAQNPTTERSRRLCLRLGCSEGLPRDQRRSASLSPSSAPDSHPSRSRFGTRPSYPWCSLSWRWQTKERALNKLKCGLEIDKCSKSKRLRKEVQVMKPNRLKSKRAVSGPSLYVHGTEPGTSPSGGEVVSGVGWQWREEAAPRSARPASHPQVCKRMRDEHGLHSHPSVTSKLQTPPSQVSPHWPSVFRLSPRCTHIHIRSLENL